MFMVTLLALQETIKDKINRLVADYLLAFSLTYLISVYIVLHVLLHM